MRIGQSAGLLPKAVMYLLLYIWVGYGRLSTTERIWVGNDQDNPPVSWLKIQSIPFRKKVIVCSGRCLVMTIRGNANGRGW